MIKQLGIRDLSPMAYAMTRIGAKLTGATIFSPGQALAPLTSPDGPPVRRFEYPIAVNLNRVPRQDYPRLTPFDTLRQLAQDHTVAALCIRVRSEHLASLDGAVVAKNKRDQQVLQRDCDAVDRWLQTPDGVTPRSAWLKILFRDLMEIDAPTIYKRPDRGGGLAALDIVDGATIKPIIDSYGRVIAYQQIIYGLQLTQYARHGVSLGDEFVVGEFSPGELLYRPYWPSSTSPYGRPPMEDMLRIAQIAIQKQKFDLAHFTDGNIPAALAVFDGQTLNPDQVLSFEQNFNDDVAANPARTGYMKFVPFPVSIERLKELTEGGRYESAQEEFNVKMTCAFYGITPSEIGFTADVNRATSEGQENVTYRISIRPIAQWLKTTIFDPIIQGELGYSALEWQWDYGESEDRLQTAQIDAIYAPLGAVSAQELRTLRYPDLDGPAPGPPAVPGSPAAFEPPGRDPVMAVLKQDVPTAAPDAEERETQIRSLQRAIRAALGNQAERVIEALQDATPDTVQAVVSALWPDEAPRLYQAIIGIYDAMVAAGLQAGAAMLPIQADFGLVNEPALQLARGRALHWAQTATKTSDKQIAQLIADWVETGGTMPALRERVRAISSRWGNERSETAAITEVTDIFARANQLAWRESGLVSGYVIETAADERVCPICGPQQGQRRDLNDTANLPPFHGRCRCWIVPEVADA